MKLPNVVTGRPELFWEMSREMQTLMVEAEPNPAHIALSDMQKQGFLSCVITQNVDNLHQVSHCHVTVNGSKSNL